MLDGEKTGGQLTMVRSATGGSASPVHVHATEDEIIVLLQGSGIFWVGDQRWELSEGGDALLPRNVLHLRRLLRRVTAIAWDRSLGVDRGVDRACGKTRGHECVRCVPREASLLVKRLLRTSVLLIIRRSWVRSPAAPPSLTCAFSQHLACSDDAGLRSACGLLPTRKESHTFRSADSRACT
jgi:hypothetical protein